MTAPTLPDHPGPLRTGLRWRPLAPTDVEGWYGLVRRMAEADRPVWSETREDLAQYLDSPANDPALTTLAGFDAGGTLRAAGRVSAAPGSAVAHTWGGGDPARRRRGVGRAGYPRPGRSPAP